MSYGMDVEVVKRPQTKAGETKVNGNGQFDAKGKALLPIKTKKVIEMKTQHEIKTLIWRYPAPKNFNYFSEHSSYH